ncbi:MAG: prolipoprotein diacylglyceryl transferase [Xanthomonadales bacterium]|nr:prolipoprotein diacylglyceryl transferase [Xanthomonadales bacterium]
MSTSSPLLWHTLFEALAYAVGVQVYRVQRRRLALPGLADPDRALWIVVAAALGAALGSKLSFWLEDPLQAFANFPDWRHLLEGKSIVGGLLGGLVGVETAKRLLGVRSSTGDAFVLALGIGLCIGRIGCFVAGLNDHTYGLPSSLPWAVDFGDGVPRHPTQLYEIAFVLPFTLWIHRYAGRGGRSGDRFRLWLSGYLLFRLLIETIKPLPMAYPPGLSGIQWLCIAGLLYYARDLPRLGRVMRGS